MAVNGSNRTEILSPRLAADCWTRFRFLSRKGNRFEVARYVHTAPMNSVTATISRPLAVKRPFHEAVMDQNQAVNTDVRMNQPMKGSQVTNAPF
jgi:hypothetical protein